ncbi:hypothetical protein [Vibrio makurazakiensis]|uniref:hypothetical protein n=1 Tax=Vibrio makurazakiensis TaxID=2910250 RepID=UPI003D097C9D
MSEQALGLQAFRRYNKGYCQIYEIIVKVSEFKSLLNSLPDDRDPELVMGEEWLPERLVNADLNGDLLFLEFDNAPEEGQGDEEGRGFVEHEITMIRHKLEQIIEGQNDTKTKADAMLAIFLMGHELSSSEVIEILEDPNSNNDE